MNSATATMIKSAMEGGDKTRRKRLKVVSACGECRRKKTKCNGEKPCAGCMKAHVECKYVNSPKSNKSTSTSAPPVVEDTLDSRILMKPTFTSKPSTSIESIEERLATIENILRALLGSGKNKHLLQGLEQQQPPPSYTSSKSFYSQSSPYQSDSLSPTSSSSSTNQPSCGDMYSSSSPHLVHVPPILNRNLPREKRQRHEDECVTDVNKKRIMIRDSHGYHSSPLLAPIKIITHQSPGIPTIKNLLNDDNDQPSPPPHSSAFFRMSHRNTAQTAAGTST